MKFAEHLSAHLTPEWISQYISYEDLKEKLYAFQKDGLEIQNENDPHF